MLHCSCSPASKISEPTLVLICVAYHTYVKRFLDIMVQAALWRFASALAGKRGAPSSLATRKQICNLHRIRAAKASKRPSPHARYVAKAFVSHFVMCTLADTCGVATVPLGVREKDRLHSIFAVREKDRSRKVFARTHDTRRSSEAFASAATPFVQQKAASRPSPVRYRYCARPVLQSFSRKPSLSFSIRRTSGACEQKKKSLHSDGRLIPASWY